MHFDAYVKHGDTATTIADGLHLDSSDYFYTTPSEQRKYYWPRIKFGFNIITDSYLFMFYLMV